jgi:hypothetical protein
MHLNKALKNLYKLLSTDEVLLRLLHYVPKNALDNPLDANKVNVMSMSVSEKKAILDTVLLPSDKKYDLDYKKVKISRICFYTGTRKPLSSYSRATKVMTDNPYASEQNYNFDIYVHVDIDTTDFRMTMIADRLNELLQLKQVTDVGDFMLDFCSPIGNTPDGFLGFKMVYKTVSLQESPNTVT